MERRMKKKGVGKAAGEASEITQLAESYADAPSTDVAPVSAASSGGNQKTLLIGGALAVAAAGAYWWYQNR
jgi:hypothetical protein